MRIILSILFCGIFILCVGQHSVRVGIAISNNVSSFPVKGYPKIFYSAFHPGIDISLERQINSNIKHQLYLGTEVGGFYHRLIQTALKINSNVTYRFQSRRAFFFEVNSGIGYLHSFLQYSVFRLDENGDYEKINVYKGRAQFLGTTAFGGGCNVFRSDPDRLLLCFQFRTFAHGLFARGYAPGIVYNAFLIGIKLRLNPNDSNCKS